MLPYVAFVLVLIVSLMTYAGLQVKNKDTVKEQINSEANLLRVELENNIANNIYALERFFERVEGNYYLNDNSIKNDLDNYFSQIPWLVAVDLPRKKNSLRYFPKRYDMQTVDKLILSCEYNHELQSLAGNYSGTVFAKDYICFYGNSRKMLMVLDLNKIFEKIHPGRFGFNSHAEVKTANNKLIFSNIDGYDTLSKNYKSEVQLKIGDTKVNLILWPTQEKVYKAIFVLPKVVLVFGFLISIIVYFLTRAWLINIEAVRRYKRAIKKQFKYKEDLSQIIKFTPQPFIQTNKEGKIIYGNYEAQRVFSCTEAELIKSNFTDFLPEKYKDLYIKQIKDINKKGSDSYTGRLNAIRLLNNAHKEVLADVRFVGIDRNGSGDIIHSISDISEIKRRESKFIAQSKRIQLIYDTTNIASEIQDFKLALQACLDCIASSLEWPIGHIYELDETNNVLKPTNIWYARDEEKAKNFKCITSRTTFNKGVGLPGRILSSRNSAWIEDVYQDTNFPRANACRDVGVHGAVGFPIILDNKVSLVFEFFSYNTKPFDHDLLRVFSVLGEQISRVLERKNAQRKIEQIENRNRMILNSAGEGIYGIDANGMTTFVNPAAEKMLGYKPGELIGKKQHSTIHHTKISGDKYNIINCPIHKTIRDGNVHHTDKEVFWKKDGTSFPVSYISRPIISHEGSIDGAVVTFNDISERKASEAKLKAYNEELNTLAFTDQLTGAYNRAKLDEIIASALARASRNDRKFALLAMDFDKFKEVNDTYGHNVGDALLVEATKRIKSVIRESDSLARLGGDEFLLHCDELASLDDVPIICKKVISVINKPFAIENNIINISVSIGISTYPVHGDKIKDLMIFADKALYKAKRLGSNRFILFDDSINDDINKKTS